jgi:hypothetical protein
MPSSAPCKVYWGMGWGEGSGTCPCWGSECMGAGHVASTGPACGLMKIPCVDSAMDLAWFCTRRETVTFMAVQDP